MPPPFESGQQQQQNGDEIIEKIEENDQENSNDEVDYTRNNIFDQKWKENTNATLSEAKHGDGIINLLSTYCNIDKANAQHKFMKWVAKPQYGQEGLGILYLANYETWDEFKDAF